MNISLSLVRTRFIFITIIIILAFTEIINNINENYIFKDDEQAEAKKDN